MHTAYLKSKWVGVGEWGRAARGRLGRWLVDKVLSLQSEGALFNTRLPKAMYKSLLP